MKKDEVKVGGTYLAKVTDKVVPVHIDAENPRGGWDGVNLTTNKKVRIKSAERLRGKAPGRGPTDDEAKAATAAIGHAPANAPQRAKKKLSKEERAVVKAQQKADARPTDATGATDDEATTEASPAPKRPTRKRAATGEPKAKRLSLINAAAQVLAESKEPMNAKAMVEQVTAKGLWSSPNGKTPHATLYSAILREIQVKGDEARFTKVERGQFAVAKGA